ncbi:unnamed protein product [Macrosiphum euphorbiae]|uniref:Uncharacterized protein n=1 Tax=Macrosiphum euphorbiae TaxID=13131 RepID=A0AAV0VRF7_9HEMI|nr:unnamed protein product [Macrosiphum euphorbiae]
MGMCVSMSTVVGYLYACVSSPPATDLLIVPFLFYVFFATFAVLPLPWSACCVMFPMDVKDVLVMYSCGYELMFGAFILPETTGKTLNEITDGFRSSSDKGRKKIVKPQIPQTQPLCSSTAGF